MLTVRLTKILLLPFAHLPIRAFSSIKKESPVSTNVIKLWHLDDKDDYVHAELFSIRFHLSVHRYNQDEYDDLYLYDSTDFSNGKDEYHDYLMDIFHSLVQLDASHLSAHELKYTFFSILRQIKEVLALLDRECIDKDAILKHILDSSKVLNSEASTIDFYMDLLKTIKVLLITNSVSIERVVLNQLVELEIFLLYSRLKAVIGADIIRDELLFSADLRLNRYPSLKRKALVHIIENSFPNVYPDYFTFKDRKPKIDGSDKVFIEIKSEEISIIKSNIQNRVISDNFDINFVTTKTINSAFLSIYDKSQMYKYSSKGVLTEIEEWTALAEAFLGPSEAKSLTARSFWFFPLKRVTPHVMNQIRCRVLRRSVVEALTAADLFIKK